MKATNILMVVAVVAVGLAVFNLVLTVNKIGELTGLATTDTGQVDLEVQSNLVINFTTDAIDWGAGYVDGATANLYTNNTVTGGTWTPINGPLVLANIGNEHCNLTLNASNNASDFIGSVSAVYEINVTEKDAGSCAGSGLVDSGWNAINTTAMIYCDNFTYGTGGDADAQDELYLHVHVGIPSSGVSVGAKSSVITAWAEVLA